MTALKFVKNKYYLIKATIALSVLMIGFRTHAQDECFAIAGNGELFSINVSNCSIDYKCTANYPFWDIAFNPLDSTLYGVYDLNFYKIDTANCTSTLIGPTFWEINSLTFAEDGTLYAMPSSSDWLCTIDVNTAALDFLGSTDTDVDPDGDLTFFNDSLYYIGTEPNGPEQVLVRIDLSNLQNSSIVGTGFGTAYGMATLGCQPQIYGASWNSLQRIKPGESPPYSNTCPFSQIIYGGIYGLAQKTFSNNSFESSFLTDTIVECESNSVLLGENLFGENFLWDDGSTSPTMLVSQSGEYSVSFEAGGCTYSDTVTVIFDSNPVEPFSLTDTILCPNETLTLDVYNNDLSYSIWQDSTVSFTYEISEAGTYTVELFNSNCSIEDSIDVDYFELAKDSILYELKDCYKESILLNAGVENGTYLWHDSSTDSIFHASHSGTYSVHVNSGSCSWNDTVEIFFNSCDESIVMPNVFTPNGDGINDYLVPLEIDGVKYFRIVILNRWGEVVFETTDKDINWEGTNKFGESLNEGVYYYQIEYQNMSGKDKVKHGFVHLEL